MTCDLATAARELLAEWKTWGPFPPAHVQNAMEALREALAHHEADAALAYAIIRRDALSDAITAIEKTRDKMIGSLFGGMDYETAKEWTGRCRDAVLALQAVAADAAAPARRDGGGG